MGHSTTDSFKIDIDTIRARLLEVHFKLTPFIVNGAVKPQFFNNIVTLCLATGNSDCAAPTYFCDLADNLLRDIKWAVGRLQETKPKLAAEYVERQRHVGTC